METASEHKIEGFVMNQDLEHDPSDESWDRIVLLNVTLDDAVEIENFEEAELHIPSMAKILILESGYLCEAVGPGRHRHYHLTLRAT